MFQTIIFSTLLLHQRPYQYLAREREKIILYSIDGIGRHHWPFSILMTLITFYSNSNVFVNAPYFDGLTHRIRGADGLPWCMVSQPSHYIRNVTVHTVALPQGFRGISVAYRICRSFSIQIQIRPGKCWICFGISTVASRRQRSRYTIIYGPSRSVTDEIKFVNILKFVSQKNT